MTKKSPKMTEQNFSKKFYGNNINFYSSVLRAFTSETPFFSFLEKKTFSIFQNWTFLKMSIFKIFTDFYFLKMNDVWS
jgi:hypothetical protein